MTPAEALQILKEEHEDYAELGPHMASCSRCEALDVLTRALSTVGSKDAICFDCMTSVVDVTGFTSPPAICSACHRTCAGGYWMRKASTCP